MPHPLFPHPDGLPADRDDRDFATLYVVRDGKTWPDPFPPEQIKDPSFFVKYGGGKYQLVARGAGGYVTARSQLFEIEGPQIPYCSPNAPAHAASLAPPASNTTGLQVFGAITTALGAGVPLLIEMLRSNRESDQRREDRIERERREDREREEQRRREDRERDERQRREDREREEARHREQMTILQQNAQNQLAIQATFSERLAAAQKDASGGSGSFKKDAFFDGVEFAKGMLENQGFSQLLPQLPSLIHAFKSGGGPPGMVPPRGFVGGPNFFGPPGATPGPGAPPGPFGPPPAGPPR